jgi:hypothetical protein
MAFVQLLKESSGAEDDSPYLSMADFFSLVSMTLIYVAMTLSFSGQKSESEIAVLTGAFSGTGPGSAVDPNTAYISVFTEGAQTVVRLVLPATSLTTETRFSPNVSNTDAAMAWLLDQLGKEFAPGKAVLYLDLTAAAPNAHKLMNELASTLQRTMEVAVVYGDGR